MKNLCGIIMLVLIQANFNPYFSQEDYSYMVYDDSEVAEIRITMDQNDLIWMYNNPLIDSLHLAELHFKNSQIDEVVDSVGIRIRGNTSRISYKKSIKLSFNTFIQGGDFYDLEKLNLNGEHNDPSIMRSKLCWDFFNSIGVISSRAAHAAVYINGKYYGLYISVEHIDEEFLQKKFSDDSGNLWKCLFGSDLTYLGNNPDLYKFENNEGNRPYSLISNEEEDDYSNLARLIDIINNSSVNDFENNLEAILNVNGVLKYLATNILVGGWDDYWSLSNNFYLYHNPTSDKFDLIPYDYDNTFGITWWDIDWSTVNPYTFAQVVPGPRPLVNKMLQIPKYRNLFTHFLKFYTDNYFDTPDFYSALESRKLKIQPYAETDTFRLVDWGFTTETFLNSFSKTDFFYENGIVIPKSIKSFVEDRTRSLNSQLNYIDSSPLIYDISLSNVRLLPDENLIINSSVFSNKGIDSVGARVSVNGGTEYYVDLKFEPVPNTLIVEESDLWRVTLPPFGESKQINLSIVAVDNLGNKIIYPDDGISVVTASPVSNEIIISELMSNNTSIISDNAGQFDDWIELYNPQEIMVDLSGKYITDKKDNLIKWQIPQGMVINPKEYILIWCDEDQEQGDNHTNFRLSSLGEFVAIIDTDGISIIDSVTFPTIGEDLSYARNSDLIWQTTSSVTPGMNNIISNNRDNVENIFRLNLTAYPNPFNPETTISYEIAESMDIKIEVFDILGKKVWDLEKKNRKTGKYKLKWNGLDNQGRQLSSGIYFVRIMGGSYLKSIKLMLLR